MHSFLMLPMQRITRLPLLTDAIASRLPPGSSELATCREALELLNGLVSECNESARSMERMEELLILSQQLDFRYNQQGSCYLPGHVALFRRPFLSTFSFQGCESNPADLGFTLAGQTRRLHENKLEGECREAHIWKESSQT